MRTTTRKPEPTDSLNNIDFNALMEIKKHTYGPSTLSEEQRWKDNGFRYHTPHYGNLFDVAHLEYTKNVFRRSAPVDFPKRMLTATHNKLLVAAYKRALETSGAWPTHDDPHYFG